MVSRRRFLTGTVTTGLALSTHRVQPLMAQPAKRLIVDSQIHMWTASTPERPWVSGARPQIPEPMTIERVVSMIDEAGVDRVIIVPPTLEGERLDYAQEAVKRYPGRFAIMGRVNLNDPQNAARLPKWREQSGVLGIRLNITGEQTKWLTDGTADWFWPVAEKAGIPTMFLTRGETLRFGPIAERYPGLPLVIDHMGVSSEAARQLPLADLIAASAALAKYPNVSVKLSGGPLFSKESYPFRDVAPHIKTLFEAFGPRRCHWGTDVTNSYAKASYKQRVTHFTEELPFLSDEDKDWIMGRAIVERLRWT
jgi:predicted TIM-barrel fold metal-dependent hydrolase